MLFLIFCLNINLLWAQNGLPQPDKNGDFRDRFVHPYWIVTDTDSGGLNGRLSPDFPINWEDCGAIWPKYPKISGWPVVIKFSSGMILNAVNGNCGMIRIDDENKKPWMMIRIDNDKICFVRSNIKYIKPVQVIK